MHHDQLALLEEILSQPHFAEWAAGNAPDMDAFWLDWTGDDPLRKEILEQAKEITISFDGKIPAISDQEIRAKVSLAIASASVDTDPITFNHAEPKSFNLRNLTGIAASLLFLLGLGWWTYHQSQPATLNSEVSSLPKTNSFSKQISIKNEGPNRRHIQLSDGSSVVLQPGSELRYPEIFEKEKREVELIGEAFFEVVKNREVPFFVTANQTLTKVVGTSFRIKAKPGAPFLEVNVKSGTVAVYKEKIKPGRSALEKNNDQVTLLKENQKAVFELSGEEIKQQLTDTQMPVRLPIESLSFVYDATPLRNVFSELEQAYGITIQYDEKQLSRCSLTAELGDEPLATKMKWIATILEAKYAISDNQITIEGKPCL